MLDNPSVDTGPSGISDPSYSRGNVTSYGTGTGAPTRGVVNPTGYVDRSLNAASQQRSGLAADAIQRRLNSGAPSAHQLHLEHLQHIGQRVTPTPHPAGTGQYYSSTASKVAAGKQNVGAPPTRVAVGQQNVPTYNNPTMANLPNDPRVAGMMDSLERQKLQYEAQNQESLQNRLSSLTQEKGLAQHQEPINESLDQARFAGRGMGYSSGLVNSLGDLKDAFARRIGGYEQQGTQAQNNYQLGLQKFLDDYIAKQGTLLGQQAGWDVPNLSNAVLSRILGTGVNQ